MKRLIAVSMVLGILVSLAACGSADGGGAGITLPWDKSKSEIDPDYDPEDLFPSGWLSVVRDDGENAYVNELGEYACPEGSEQIGGTPFGPNGRAIRIGTHSMDTPFSIIDAEMQEVAQIDLSAWEESDIGSGSVEFFYPFDANRHSLFLCRYWNSAATNSNERYSFRWGIVNDEGKVMVPPEYECLTPMSAEGTALACREYGGKLLNEIELLLVDDKGNETTLSTRALPVCFTNKVPPDGNELIPAFATDGRTVVTEYGDKCAMGYLNTNGEWAIEPQFYPCLSFHFGRAIASSGEGYYFIDTEGRKVSDTYDHIYDFTKDGLAMVANYENSYYMTGYIDLDGNEVIPTQYYGGTAFCDGIAWVGTGSEKYLCIDTSGQELYTYENPYDTDLVALSGGYAAIRRRDSQRDDHRDTWYFIDATGKEQLIDLDVAAFTTSYGSSKGSSLSIDSKTGVAVVDLEELVDSESSQHRYACLIDAQGQRVGTATFLSWETPAERLNLPLAFSYGYWGDPLYTADSYYYNEDIQQMMAGEPMPLPW